jgi:hypothetical protein
MPIQKCPMCGESKNVVSSHLIPAALYKECRLPGGHPIVFNSRLVYESSRQMQSPLLCEDCEDILNKGGENWMVPLLAKADGSFGLHDLLTSLPPAAVIEDARVYFAAQHSKIDSSKIIHFAMGVFWKAAVHPWIPGEKEPLIDLREFAEPVRTFLKGESPFPNEMVLTVGILPVPVKHLAISAPYQGSNMKVTNFLFYAVGIEFSLLVGSAITDEERGGSFSANANRPIIVVDFSPMLREITVATMKTAHKAKNVQKYLKKR